MFSADDQTPEGSWLDGAADRFATANDDLVMHTRSVLNRIVNDEESHARLINTLSMLEHIGSHKIMATQHVDGFDQATLKHIAEEAHHAYFMKRQAEKSAGRSLEYSNSDLLAPASARMYFQRLEAAIVHVLNEQRSWHAAYLYMSMIVEFRALWFYRLYEQTLKRAGHAMSLKRVLGEEQNHLVDMANRLDLAGDLNDTRVDAFMDTERRLYQRMLNAIRLAVV